MVARPIDYGDIQGLVRFGYGGMTEACFFLLEVRNSAASRQWLASAPVANAAAMDPPPEHAMQVAFTWDGLEALGLPRRIGEGFSSEFLSGMTGEESRSRRLGDVGTSAPGEWRWGGRGKVPHAVVLLYSKPGGLESWKRTIQSGAWAVAFREIVCLPTSNLDGIEPFGFRDGISQPSLDWDRIRKPASDEFEYGNLLALGEFLLGYPNEYGKYTLRPLLAEADDPRRLLAPAEDDPGRRDLGRNGTYLVLRELEQDVAGFWRFLDARAQGDAQARRRLAESMVGRTMEGGPLVPATDRRIAGVGPEDELLNRFTYDADREGLRCPVGAHVRRANPRNADFPPGSKGLFARLRRIAGFGGKGFHDDLVASSRFHRVLRRGREYGPGLSPEDALRFDRSYVEPRGLHFVCLNANIARQFEFVQNAWMMGTKFAGLSDESDPLLGSRQKIAGCLATDTISIPREGQLSGRITGIPRFVTVRGGAYFFLPSVSALRYLASLES